MKRPWVVDISETVSDSTRKHLTILFGGYLVFWGKINE